jgi:hypothetical protein
MSGQTLREYKVQRAGIRVTESNARSHSIERIQIEGVIQEAFASSELESYYVGQIASISKRLGFERTCFKPLVDGEENLEVENWQAMHKEQLTTHQVSQSGGRLQSFCRQA